MLTVRGPDRLQGVDLDLSGCAELAPVVTTVAACAAGQSSITGIAHTRLHESDRIAVMATELNRCGAGVTELADGLVVQPRPLHGELIRTYDDHRIAMSAAVLGLVVPGTRVENVETAGKTVPDFAQWWQATVTVEHA